MPFEQLSPALALLHPFGRLKAQQRRCFCGVSNALLIRPGGILGPRLLPARPLGPSLPLIGCCLRGVRDLLFGFDDLGAAGALGEFPDKGRR